MAPTTRKRWLGYIDFSFLFTWLAVSSKRNAITFLVGKIELLGIKFMFYFNGSE